MKTYSSSQPILHSDGWRFFSLLIVCVTVPILLSMMVPSSRGESRETDLLRQHHQAGHTYQYRRDYEEESEEIEKSIIAQRRRRPRCHVRVRRRPADAARAAAAAGGLPVRARLMAGEAMTH